MLTSVESKVQDHALLGSRIGAFVAGTSSGRFRTMSSSTESASSSDTVACTVGGIVRARHDALLDAALATAGPGRPRSSCRARRSTVTAAIVNSEAGGVLAASDSFYFSHAATLVFANALALTESTGGTGSDLLTAFVAGLETASVLNILSPSNLPPGERGGGKRSQTDRLRSAGGRLNYVAVGAAAAAARLSAWTPNAHPTPLRSLRSPRRRGSLRRGRAGAA